MRPEIGVAPELDLQRRDVVSAVALGLQFVVVDYGVVAGDQLGYRIGQISSAVPAVSLHDGRLAAGFRNDQHPRVPDGGLAVGGGFHRQFDGLFDLRALGDVDVDAVFKVGCVQGHEGVVLVARVAREERLYRRLGQFHYPHAGSLPGRRRPWAGPTRREIRTGNRSHARKTPVFVVRGGIAQLAETLAGLLANLVDHAVSTISAYPDSSNSSARFLPPD